MMLKTLFLSVLLFSFSGLAAHAGTQDNAKVALHISSWCDKAQPSTCCNAFGPLSESPRKTCADFSTDFPDTPGFYRPWLVVAQADPGVGISEVSFGISPLSDAQGFGFFGFYDCFGSSTTQLLDNEGGVRFVWDDCQNNVVGEDGVHAIAGSIYLYAYGGPAEFAVTPNYLEGETAIVVWDCNGERSELTSPGGIVGYQTPGFNPCVDEGVPTSESTWGKIKTSMGN
ncbi:MAG: hypothetical protein HKN21_17540 [Candidatus Eisenbacteria bacterium]|uniref:Uncharacterized protein n=1 Tax=Eiseniibacteriota bacterium TaxID=2212470 RepID=A0A7Y2H3W4_UNCEI|nr:hypothetical protein [Candidatus Eisenbacteria bacterium]